MTSLPPGMTPEMRLQQRELLRQEHLCWSRNDSLQQTGVLFCPLTFDGIACWNPTPAGAVATQPCPHYFKGFIPQYQASKECTSNGTWYFSAEHNSSWTDYGNCHLPSILHKHLDYTDSEIIQVWTPVIKIISRIGYGISLTALLLAMIIFCSIRKLRSCPRTNLHTHLFVSFILKAAMWVAMDSVSRDSLDPDYPGSWLCKMVTAAWQYFTMANYSWVTMEGLYLFCLIYMAMFSDHSSITVYVLIGWGFPVYFVVPWVIVRALEENVFCWRVNIKEGFFWIIRGPTIFLIMVNAVLFVFIVLVLMQKLNASISVETRRYRYRKLARSTLVLIPLFGFHYVVFVGLSAFMNVNRVLELIWLFGDQLFASFQGCFVAILYCFMSSEVKLELAKLWAAWRYSHFGIPALSRRGRHNHGKSSRSTGRSSVQSTTLMERTCEVGLSRAPSSNAKSTAESRTSPRQLCVAEAIKEVSLDESSEQQQLMLPSSAATPEYRDNPDPGNISSVTFAPVTYDSRIWPASDITVTFDGINGGSVHLQRSEPTDERAHAV